MKFDLRVLTAFFLCLNMGVNAQVADLSPSNLVDVEVGPEYKSKNALIDIVAHDEDHFYTILEKRSIVNMGVLAGQPKAFLARFNNAMELEQETELEMEFEGNELDYERLFMQNGNLYLFSSFMNKKQKVRYAFYQTIDKETLVPNKDIKKIAEVGGDSKKELKSTGFSVFRSKDNGKTVVYYDLPFAEDENERYGVHVFDDQMNMLWTKEIELPFADENFYITSRKVAENGDVYIMGRLWKDKKEREKKEVNYKYVVIELTEEGTKLNQYEVDLDEKYVSSMILRLNDQNELLCGGFYALFDSYGAMGSFFVKINRETGKITHKSFEPFDESFIVEDLDKKAKKKANRRMDKDKNVGISRLELDDIVLREDGGGIIVGERRWIETRTTTDSRGNTRTYYIYHNNDIILVNIDPNGNIEWNARIPKEQTMNNSDYFSSYLIAISGSDMLFIFNDNPKNLMYNGDGKIERMNLKKNYVALVRVDSDGRVFRKALMKEYGGKTIVRPLVSEQLLNDDIILYSERGKRKQFIRVNPKN